MKTLLRRIIVVLIITLAAWAIAWAAGKTPGIRSAVQLADTVFYDAFYRQRPIDDRTGGDVVIVAIDQQSLTQVDKALDFGWPWPRQYWAFAAKKLGEFGAKAVVLDLVFTEKSVYDHSDDDDNGFAEAAGNAGVPIIYGSLVKPDGNWQNFAPPIKSPALGAVNTAGEKVERHYPATIADKPSLALASLRAAGMQPKFQPDEPFLLHYYGPYKNKDGKTTFRYISAINVLDAALPKATKKETDEAAIRARPLADLVRGKIVLIGGVTPGLNDMKSTPLSEEYPGVEIQATAMENLLAGQEVTPVSAPAQQATALLAALLAAVIVVFPRNAVLKTLGPVLAVAGIITLSLLLFKGVEIRWLSATGPLLAVALATIAAFTWTYFAEDRQRKFMLKALSKVVSPAVAEQLARDPARLALGTYGTRITLLFTDLANFTSVSEHMNVEKVGQFINRYLGEMSDQVLANEGTLDKYIGDAVMCFWNAPLPQEDHAVRACRAALAITARENLIRAELMALGASQVFTRVGINTADVAVGFVGSSHLFNYTAMGDGVNLASRLEGANKIYGTQIMISQATADLVKDQFILRKLDLLRVKGKSRPLAVYELLAPRDQGGGDAELAQLAAAYESALDRYRRQDWDAAEKELLELLARFKDDGPAKGLLKRISSLRHSALAPDWDGVYEAKEK